MDVCVVASATTSQPTRRKIERKKWGIWSLLAVDEMLKFWDYLYVVDDKACQTLGEADPTLQHSSFAFSACCEYIVWFATAIILGHLALKKLHRAAENRIYVSSTAQHDKKIIKMKSS